MDEAAEDREDTQARRQDAFPNIDWTGADYERTEIMHWKAMKSYFSKIQSGLDNAIGCWRQLLLQGCDAERRLFLLQ